jgi:hypothetical protein
VWLEKYNLLKPLRFIDALRINTFGTRTVLARADKKVDIVCRSPAGNPRTHLRVMPIHQSPID